MAEERVNLSSEPSIDYHIVTLFEKLEALRNDKPNSQFTSKLSIKVEVRTLEFWRSVISECIASFVYVFVVCGAKAGAFDGGSATTSLGVLSTALAAGFAMISLTQCFGHISGAHINPAVSLAMGITKNISLLRTTMFIVAQCGGAIAGAAFLYGVSIPRTQEDLPMSLPIKDGPWERFGNEFILTFVVVLAYFVSMDAQRRWMGMSAITIGATYSACSFVSPMPHLNPARSLGPSFVLKKWDNHWVYWLGPIIGGVAAGLIHEYIFNSKRSKRQNSSSDGDSSSIQSDEDTYDDLDKPNAPKYQESTYNSYRAGAPNGPTGYCPSLTSASLYSTPATKLERVESLYGGTRSLYCKSPPLTRANLNRSQSVYTKNSGGPRDILPKPGPLVPTQSLHSIKLNQQTHVHNQNLQNQLQQRSESVYGVRGNPPGSLSRPETEKSAYPSKNSAPNSEESKKNSKINRPESMYGIMSLQRRGQSAQSDDSSYGSYHGPAPRNNTYHSNTSGFQNKAGSVASYVSRNAGSAEGRPPPSANQLLTTTGNPTNSYHHHQHSPSSQY
ncbi:neurogenic protein big brain [Tribolium castaneum]|uniref:Neurogenic protein big brain-like Protein n=2 Tax=Tribolium castaneum TaxID=7070 RepID=D6W7H3_TRICA|nr:PREDICTED: neurogenic protein big brain [Tribolium castaneum]EFA11295.1 Neurogenic protein big brain-like Protein [Tribolium castaneum]|eukprot:XP_968782.1 PREDICTED: neurogenic protein big brain [Tribolium castaneum]